MQTQIDELEIQPQSFSTLFIGGGTPSTLDIASYEQIFSLITPYLKDGIEITTEINPSAKKDWLKEMQNFGINRISMGVQSFDDEKLKLLGRNHTSKKAHITLENLFAVGYQNVSLDLIYDVCSDTQDTLKQDLAAATQYDIKHLSSYALTIEPNTAFEHKINMKQDNEELCIFWFDYIQEQGFDAYEISNFAKAPQYQSEHNKGYWNYTEYIGTGSGAIGYHSGHRLTSESNIEKYILDPTAKTREEIDTEKQKIEKIFLGLRSHLGVDTKLLSKQGLTKAQILLQEHKLTEKNGKLYNPNFLLSDEIALFICD